LGDIEEVVAHLEDILAYILRASNFKRKYIFPKCPEFHQMNVIP